MQVSGDVTAPIREPVLRGHQTVAALWFPTAWFDATTRAARIIACWRPGATALRFAQGDLLCYATPIEENSDQLPGWALRQEGVALCSAPLSGVERAGFREGDVWIVLGAEVLTLHKRNAEPLDPSAWLAVDHLTLLETYDCTVPLPAAVVLDLESRPLREVLGDAVPSASQERAEFLEAMQRAQQKDPGGARRSLREPGRGMGPLFVVTAIAIAILAIVAIVASGRTNYFFLWMVGIIVLIRLILGASSRSGGVGGAAGARPVAQPGGLRSRSPLAHPQRWRRWLARIAVTTQLSRLLGRAQARHLRRVLDFFDDGNLAEALRHAIPLGGDHGSLGQSFGMPGRRGSLDLTKAYGPSTTIGLEEDLQNHLRALYRQAFEKLDREQRFDEAVFVLAELLNAKREALDYLEKHERFAQAAELALGWDMAPDVIVRLHCLAGDWRRAVAVARRDNAFSTAVIQLEKRWPDAAHRLREEWGNALIQQGDWVGAVNAVWPVESLRANATQWLRTAEAAGGRLGMRALVQRAVLLPDTVERYSKEILALQTDRSLWSDRLELAEALMSIGRTPATQQLCALITPAVLADHAQGFCRFDQTTLQKLVQSTGDVLLQADLPDRNWPAVSSEPAAKRTEVLELIAPDAGAHAILDAVPLDDQCYLLALGESGACVVDATGRVRARFATPAQKVVLAHSKQVALLLARRETLWRVSRLDLTRKTIVDLGMLAFDCWADQFDGLHWTVAQGRQLRVHDTQESLRQIVWQVTDLPGDVRVLATSATMEQIVLDIQGKPPERWSYRLPQRQLLARDDAPFVEGNVTLLNPAGGVVGITIEESGGLIGLRWQVQRRSPQYHVQTAQPESLRLWVNGEWLVVITSEESHHAVRWLLLATGNEYVRTQWPVDADPYVRAYADEWLLFDARGRVLSFNLGTCARQAFCLR